MKTGRIFAPHGLLALAPAAFGMLFDIPDPTMPQDQNGVAVVTIRGPLMHHGGWWCDSYDGIKARVAEAIEARPKAIMLAIDSPGGLVSGCFETSQELRAMCDAAKVPLHAFVDGQATSAAYAIACAASRITAPKTAMVGSVGVIDALVDATKQDAMYGVSFELITSGARKSDGNPHAPITPEARASRQEIVDELAGAFFALVGEARGMAPAAVQKLEAGIFTGAQSLRIGLVDAVGTMDEALAFASGDGGSVEEDKKDESSSAYKDAVAALRKAAEKDDEDGKAAKKMLAALDDEKDDDAESDKDEGESKSESSEDTDEKSAKSMAGEALRVAQVTALLSDRPDLTTEQRKAFRKLDAGALEAVLAVTPRASRPDPAAASKVQPTLGKDQGGPAPTTNPQLAAMDRLMGLAAPTPAVRRDGAGMVFGALGHDEARSIAKNGVAR